MSKIISIGTSVPANKYDQNELLLFADEIFSKNEEDSRKLKYLYRQSGISHRYSVIQEFRETGKQGDFFPGSEDLKKFPSLEKRMQYFNDYAPALSAEAIERCIEGQISKSEITHLITVTCTGISAPGLDLQVMEMMGLSGQIVRTAVNFMGCYAAVHALKLADAFCNGDENANVVIVCTELCTLHFQENNSIDNITSSLLFGDGSAAMLVQHSNSITKGIQLKSFFSDVAFKGKKEMAWELSSRGFLMTLTGYIPELIKEDFEKLVTKALAAINLPLENVSHWCIHPGGKQILQSITGSLNIDPECLRYSYDILNEYGNMSSPTIVFVLKKFLDEFSNQAPHKPPLLFGAAFGPGLTMETFTATYD